MSRTVKYTAAQVHDDIVVINGGNVSIIKKEEASSSSSPSAACRTCVLTTALFGLGFILTGIFSYFLIKKFVEEKILENYSIKDGSPFYVGWKDPPVTPLLSIYFFNFTNYKDFLSGKTTKPELVEVGPYVYAQELRRTDVKFTSNHSVNYSVLRRHYFSPELTGIGVRSEDDVLILPNVPLLGAIQKVSKDGGFAKRVFESLLSGYDFAKDGTPFLTISVKDFLWGYPSVLLAMDKVSKCEVDFMSFDAKEENCDITAFNLPKFGLFSARNGTANNSREINTGALNIQDKGLMISWLGKKKLDYWSENSCNIVRGRDPGSLPLDIHKSDTLPIFIGQLCRLIDFEYVKEINYRGMLTYRFVVKNTTFNSPRDTPENACYCRARPCLPSGLLDISGCQPGSPVYMSWPHFLYGDPKLVDRIVGLHPDAEKHSFYMDIEPKYGIQLSVLARIQMNVIISRDKDFSWFSKLKNKQTILPFLWIEEGLIGPPDDMFRTVYKLLTLPDDVKYGMSFAALCLGIILLIPQIAFLVKRCPKK